MNIRSIIKSVIPERVMNSLKDCKACTRLYRDYARQCKRFERSYSREWSNGLTQVQARLMFLTHQIEKGLGHQSFRYGFGSHVFAELGPVLTKMECIDPDYLTNSIYRECMGAVHEYIERHQAASKDLSVQRQCLTVEQWNRAEEWTSGDGGSVVLEAAQKAKNPTLPFVDLLSQRHSLREYSDEPVSVENLRSAVELATRAPSACNRQPGRATAICNPSIISELLKIQGGVRGYDMPPALLLVTSKQSVFMGPDERNQAYVDGALFAMTLLLSLEALGLASCPLHAMLDGEKEAETRSILGIPDDEVLIMYIEVGHFPRSVRTPMSTRLLVEDVFRVVE